jgi:streptomycin 3"-adenylyltransferase
MTQYGWTNPPDATRGQISRLISALRKRFEGNMVGVYLHGSLAMGCFNPNLSDVDLLVVTREPVIVDAQKGLVEELLALSKAPTPLEISLLAQSDLQPWRYPTPYQFHYSESLREKLSKDVTSGAWRQWNQVEKLDKDLAAHVMVIRARGICLWGKPIESVFPDVPKPDYIDSIMSDLQWSKSLLIRNPIYPILNLCRVLAYLREGIIFSKDEGGRWALEHLPSPLLLVVRSAMSSYSGLYQDMYVPEDKVVTFYDRMLADIRAALPAQG